MALPGPPVNPSFIILTAETARNPGVLQRLLTLLSELKKKGHVLKHQADW